MELKNILETDINIINYIFVLSMFTNSTYGPGYEVVRNYFLTHLYSTTIEQSTFSWFGNTSNVIQQKLNILFENIKIDCIVDDIKIYYDDVYHDGNLVIVIDCIFNKIKMSCIVFRGLTTSKNTSTIMYQLIPRKHKLDSNKNHKVGYSFYKGFESIYTKISNIQFKYNTIVCCGHSLGGVYASLFSYKLIEKGCDNVNLFTYNSPRVGNINFAQFLNDNLQVNYRMSIWPDIIPTTPPKYTGFCHTGRPVQLSINCKYKYIKFKNLVIYNGETLDCTELDMEPTFLGSIHNLNYNTKNFILAHMYFCFGTNKPVIIPDRKDIPFFNLNLYKTNHITNYNNVYDNDLFKRYGNFNNNDTWYDTYHLHQYGFVFLHHCIRLQYHP